VGQFSTGIYRYAIGKDIATSKIAFLHYNGVVWSKDTIALSNLYGDGSRLKVFSSNNIWVCSYNDVYHYDGGQWNKTELGIGTLSSSFTALSFSDENNGCMISNNGKIFLWNGVGWGKGVDAPEYITGSNTNANHYRDIQYINSNEIWSVGYSYNFTSYPFYLYRFNGSDWKSINTQDNNTIYGNSIQMVNSSLGWIVGGISSQSAIYRYDGANWIAVTSPTSSILNKVFMLNANSGWAVGNDGIILKYK
jgi:photosystem II stability/assembly factor-like uncharacterized protein